MHASRSFSFGLVHAIVLSPYEPYCGGSLPCKVYQPSLNVGPSGNSAQYEWLAREVKKVNDCFWLCVLAYVVSPFLFCIPCTCRGLAMQPVVQARVYCVHTLLSDLQTSQSCRGITLVHVHATF